MNKTPSSYIEPNQKLRNLEQEKAQAEHRSQRLQNRERYLSEGARKKRTHHLCNMGGAIEALCPQVAALNKADFYHNEAGQELAIRLDSLPSAMMVDPSVPHGPCPGSAMRDTCYSSDLVVQVKNNYSPFDQILEYTVFDAEGLASNRAKIYLNNTAKNTVTSGGGGGSIGWWSLLGLLGLGLYRRHSQTKKR